jgi:hypothetical protein
LSRRPGFNLQAASQAANGLPAVTVARPSRWGNPFPIGADGIPDAATAVANFRAALMRQLKEEPERLAPLRRHNLACWCALDQPCHADLLLEWANR